MVSTQNYFLFIPADHYLDEETSYVPTNYLLVMQQYGESILDLFEPSGIIFFRDQ